jgi:hypothetical protein
MAGCTWAGSSPSTVEAPVPDMLGALTGGCPKREAFNIHDRCDPFAPGLQG